MPVKREVAVTPVKGERHFESPGQDVPEAGLGDLQAKRGRGRPRQLVDLTGKASQPVEECQAEWNGTLAGKMNDAKQLDESCDWTSVTSK